MTLTQGYFDALYADSPDPWSFASRWYEERKRALTVALLPEFRYGDAYEPGCSIGVLTTQLAARCDRLLSSDIAPSAVAAAKERTAALSNVTVVQAALPREWPSLEFDLVVLSELGYYFSPADASAVAGRAFTSATTVLAVHWRPRVTDYPLTGDEVHELLADAAAANGHHRLGHYLDDDLVADLWSSDPRSVAARTDVR